MKRYYPFAFLTAILAMLFLIRTVSVQLPLSGGGKTPNDWFFLQRSFPYPEINYQARNTAWMQAEVMKSEYATRGEGWVLEGPYNIGGRISAVAMTSTSDPLTIYAGAASGGIFRSINNGNTW